MPEQRLGVMYQRNEPAPENWEFRFLDGTYPGAEWADLPREDIQLSPNYAECWDAVYLGEDGLNGWIESRAVGPLGHSFWSYPHRVPEVDFITGILVGTLLVGALYERAWARRRNRTVRGLRLPRQRQTLRGRLRQMFRRGLRMVGFGR